MRNVLSNAFSINMINDMIPMNDNTSYMGLGISIKEVNSEDIPRDVISVIGHIDTATVVSNILNFTIPANRVTYKIEKGDTLYIAQYNGPRLPEGTTQLPEGASIKFYKLSALYDDQGSGLSYESTF